MKVDQRFLDVQSTLQGERVGMTIAPDAMSHIMAILTDLYSDPEMAVMREYSTNALDAHIASGVSMPIEVALPTTLSPYLRIRDFGDGLDADDIREIYSQYGASTKRDTDDQVGSLGLGCKSALTYTDQFTLQGIKNGVATQVAISRDEDGAGSMTIVAQYETDEVSGVEITIPVKAYHSFPQKAQKLFRFWDQGTVLVNGEEPQVLEGGYEIDPGIFLYEKTHLSHSYVVMGGVAYPFTADDDDHYSVVAYVPMGAVSFTPSREALNMNTKTKAVVADIGLRITNSKETMVKKFVEEAKSKPEALVTALRVTKLFRYDGTVTYRGKALPDFIETPHDVSKKHGIEISVPRETFTVWRTKNSSRYVKMIGEAFKLPISTLPQSFFVTGFDPKNLTITHRNKIKQYMSENDIDIYEIEQIVMVRRSSFQHASWVDRSRIVSFATIQAVKLAKDPTDLADRPTGSYRVIVSSADSTRLTTIAEKAEDLATQAPQHLFWEPYIKEADRYGYRDSERGRREGIARARMIVRAQHPNAVFVTLQANRVGKFEREFPQAQRVQPAARAMAQAWFDALTIEERNFLSIQKLDSREGWAMLNPRQIQDPKLKALIKAAAQKNDKLIKQAAQFGNLYTGTFEEIEVDHYPLLDFPSRYDSTSKELKLQHVVLYLNAVYTASKTKKGN